MGTASGFSENRAAKWIVKPSISVVYWGKLLARFSIDRLRWSVPDSYKARWFKYQSNLFNHSAFIVDIHSWVTPYRPSA